MPAVDVIAAILARERPRVVFFPHDTDWNSTHIGTHHLVVDALARLPADFTCTAIETEFWGAMASPNLMVESTADDVAEMMTALSFHVGEVERNPYHLLLPAWMQDNVRRGGELVGGQGGRRARLLVLHALPAARVARRRAAPHLCRRAEPAGRHQRRRTAGLTGSRLQAPGVCAPATGRRQP